MFPSFLRATTSLGGIAACGNPHRYAPPMRSVSSLHDRVVLRDGIIMMPRPGRVNPRTVRLSAEAADRVGRRIHATRAPHCRTGVGRNALALVSRMRRDMKCRDADPGPTTYEKNGPRISSAPLRAALHPGNENRVRGATPRGPWRGSRRPRCAACPIGCRARGHLRARRRRPCRWRRPRW